MTGSPSYISIYFQGMGKFTVDERGYNLRTTRCYDRIEWSPESENLTPTNHEKVYLFYMRLSVAPISLNLLRPEKGDKNDE